MELMAVLLYFYLFLRNVVIYLIVGCGLFCVLPCSDRDVLACISCVFFPLQQ